MVLQMDEIYEITSVTCTIAFLNVYYLCKTLAEGPKKEEKSPHID